MSSSFFFSLQGKAPKEIHAILTETLACFLPGRAKDLSAPLCNAGFPFFSTLRHPDNRFENISFFIFPSSTQEPPRKNSWVEKILEGRLPPPCVHQVTPTILAISKIYLKPSTQ